MAKTQDEIARILYQAYVDNGPEDPEDAPDFKALDKDEAYRWEEVAGAAVQIKNDALQAVFGG